MAEGNTRTRDAQGGISPTALLQAAAVDVWRSVRGDGALSWARFGLEGRASASQIADVDDAPVSLLAAILTAFVMALLCASVCAELAWWATRVTDVPASLLTAVVAVPVTALGFGLVMGHVESLAGGLAATVIGSVLGAATLPPIAWIYRAAHGQTPEKLTYVAIGLTCGCCIGAFEANARRTTATTARSTLRAVADGLLLLALATGLGVGLYYLAQVPSDKPSSSVGTLFSGLLLLLGITVFFLGIGADTNWKAALKRMTLPAGYFLCFGAATSFVMDRRQTLNAISETLYGALESSGFGLLAGSCVAMTSSIALRLVPPCKLDVTIRLVAIIATWVLLFSLAFRHLDSTYRWWSVAVTPLGTLAGAGVQRCLLGGARPSSHHAAIGQSP